MKTIVIVGGNSRIAEECAKAWLETDNRRLILIGRNLEKLCTIQNDLKIRFAKSMIDVIAIDFFDIFQIQKTVSSIFETYSPDIVLIAQGLLTPQIACQNDLQKTKEMLEVNGQSVILFAEAFANFFAKQQLGHMVIIGSVAGNRGRKSNYIYGASKAMIEKYVQGLQQRFAHTPIKITLIKSGLTDTPMTIEFKEKGLKMASPQKVVKKIVEGIQKNNRLFYAPGHWKFIMTVIRFLPFFVFKRMDI